MAFVNKYGAEVDNPRMGRPTLDDDAIRRILDTMMLAMDERGWSLSQIARAVGFPKSTVDHRLASIPPEVKTYCREVAQSMLGFIPGPVDFTAGLVAAGLLKRQARELAARQSIAARQREAQEMLDSLCLEALAKHGTAWEAARSLGITTRRVKDAIERRRAHGET